MTVLFTALEKLSIVVISVPIPSTNLILTRVRRQATQVCSYIKFWDGKQVFGLTTRQDIVSFRGSETIKSCGSSEIF